MILSQFKQHLDSVSAVNFVKPDGGLVPKHFHITEAGLITKNFIDCGGTVRTEKNISFQLWVAQDLHHRLEPHKLKKIIGIYEKLFGNEDLEIEVEYQSDTIGRYGLAFDGENFLLTTKATDCLAKDNCGVTPAKQVVQLSSLKPSSAACCAPGEGCC